MITPIRVGVAGKSSPDCLLKRPDCPLCLTGGFAVANSVMQMLDAKLPQLLRESTSSLHAVVCVHPVRLTSPGNNLTVEPLRSAKSMLAF